MGTFKHLWMCRRYFSFEYSLWSFLFGVRVFATQEENVSFNLKSNKTNDLSFKADSSLYKYVLSLPVFILHASEYSCVEFQKKS